MVKENDGFDDKVGHTKTQEIGTRVFEALRVGNSLG
jgi:hypothetical protein